MTATASPALSSLHERAAAFTTAVRAQLADLPTDELDELLDGLGADIEERLADGGELGDPALYAEELRQAAGLPPRGSAPKRERRSLAQRSASLKSRIAAWFAKTPARSGARDFLLSLRPVWWIIRALAITWIVLVLLQHPTVHGLPLSFISMLAFVGAAIVSVQWGRGKWLPHNWLRHVRTVASIAAVVLVVPLFGIVWNVLASTGPSYTQEDFTPPGLSQNGSAITNIFAFDCAGDPIDLVRLYDQNGDPIETGYPDGSGSFVQPDYWDEAEQAQYSYGYHPLAKDAEAWNAFPLTTRKYSEPTGTLGTPREAIPKRSELLPLNRECPATQDSSESEDGTVSGTADGSNTKNATKEATKEATQPAATTPGAAN